MAGERPQTIDELRAFAERHNLPLEKMRFFIGVNTREPKAFGIYEDLWGTFVVYKNKADGTRAVRYEGRDEARAVGELYDKMREEIAKQPAWRAKVEARREAEAGEPGDVELFALDEGESDSADEPAAQGSWQGRSYTPAVMANRGRAHSQAEQSERSSVAAARTQPKGSRFLGFLGDLAWDPVGLVQKVVAIILGVAILGGIASAIPSCGKKIHRGARGYYQYDDDTYYYLDDWYYWDGYAWTYGMPPDEFFDDEDWEDEYYYGSEYDDGYGVDDFYGTSYYDEYLERQTSSSYDDDDDDDRSWSWDDDDDDWSWDDDDDWDSSTTDWGSDW